MTSAPPAATYALFVGGNWRPAQDNRTSERTGPSDGYESSGIGRELGREGLREYFETKSIHLRLGQI